MAQNNRQSEVNPTISYTFNILERVWLYWERVLPRVAYAKYGMSTHTLVDDGVAFVCYCLDEMDLEKFPVKPAKYNFRDTVWDAITGFGELSNYVEEVSERIDDLLRNRRIHQLYLEHCLRARGSGKQDDRTKRTGYWTKKTRADDILAFPSHDGVKGIWRPLYSHLSQGNLRESVNCALVLGHIQAKEVTVTLSPDTQEQFNKYLGRFQIPAVAALTLILTLLQRYMPLNSTYTNSFRGDLFDRYLACKTINLRWLDQVAIYESLAFEGDDYARIVAERLSVLNKNLKSGQSVAEFMSGELTARENPDTDYSLATDLKLHERLGAEGMI